MKRVILIAFAGAAIAGIFAYELQQIQGKAIAQTIWGSAHLVTGPVPAVASFLHRTPLVGSVFSREFSQITQQRQFVRVIRALDGYLWRDLPAEVGMVIDPKFFDSRSAYRNRLIALDDYLELRQENARLTSLPISNVSRQLRAQADADYLEIVAFRQILGVPVRIRGKKDLDELLPGTEFIGPDGEHGVKR